VPGATGVQHALVSEEPDRFFVPAYVGHRGWLGVRLDRDLDWDEVAGIIEDAYRLVAPRSSSSSSTIPSPDDRIAVPQKWGDVCQSRRAARRALRRR
jgi:hypothetical protein